MIHRAIAILALCLLAAGCTSAAQRAQRDEEGCARRGYQTGSKEHKDCLTRSETERQVRMDARHREMMEKSSLQLYR